MKRIRDLAAFTTVLPLETGDRSFLRASRSGYLLPAMGWATGFLAAAASLPFLGISPLTAAIVAISASVLFSRGLHLDGLMDTGDALLCHGDREARLRALKDIQIGAGGLAAAIAIYGISAASLAAAPDLLRLVVLSEVVAKLGTVSVIATSEPLGDGLGASFVEGTRWWHLAAAAALASPVVLLHSPLRVASVAILSVLVVTSSGRGISLVLGGVNGDVMGASNEIARTLSIVLGVLVW